MSGSNGIDLSSWQTGKIITGMPGLDFVIAKASEGVTLEDDMYQSWASGAERVQAQFGAYHFAHPENLKARAEADFFCATAQPRSGLSLWVDYESYGDSGQIDAEWLGYFVCEVKRNVGNQQKVGIYCNGEGLARIQPYLHEIPYNGLWYADPDRGMTVQNPAMSWQVHQYEVFEGIDRNWSVWSAEEWISYWKW